MSTGPSSGAEPGAGTPGAGSSGTGTPGTGRRADRALRGLGRLPGALMVIPLLLGATLNTAAPGVLDLGSYTTDLFRDGVGTLLGLFFFCMGAQLDFRAGYVTLEKGVTLFVGKVFSGIAIGYAVAFLLPGGDLLGLTPLVLIAAITNSNSTLFVALMKQFGNPSDRNSVAVLSLNDGPFITLLALGVAGLAAFPLEAVAGILLPLVIGFVVGNLSAQAREFLRSGEMLLIPFLGFAVGAGIDFATLGQAGAQGIVLGLVTVFVVGAVSMGLLWLLHVARRRPKSARSVVAGAAESTTAGNAIATPAAVALVDPTYRAIQSVATAQIAAATITTGLLVPFLVAAVSRWQRRRGVSPEAEDEWNFGGPAGPADSAERPPGVGGGG